MSNHTNSVTTRRVRFLGTRAAAAALVAIAIGAGATAADAAPRFPSCTVDDGTYSTTCRMVPGHADGWFIRQALDALPDPPAATTVPWSRVR